MKYRQKVVTIYISLVLEDIQKGYQQQGCDLYASMKFNFFYLNNSFLSQALKIRGTAGEGRRPSLFLSTTYTYPRTFKHLFAFEMTTTYFSSHHL